MYKGKEKRPKHMRESQPRWLQKLVIKAIVKLITEIATAVALLLVNKYLQ